MSFISDNVTNPPEGKFPWFPWFEATAFVYPPGVGKTQSLTEALNALLPDYRYGDVLVVGPTHELLTEISEKLKMPAVHLYGRNEDNCQYPDVAKAMSQQHLPMGQAICKDMCPVRKSCQYYAQFEQPGHILLMTPQMARSMRFRFKRGEDGKSAIRNYALLVYDDVNPISGFVEEFKVTIEELKRVANLPKLSQWQRLICLLATALAGYTEAHSGKEFWEWMAEAMGGYGYLVAWVTLLTELPLPPENKPNLPRDRMPTASEVNAQLPAFVNPLFKILRKEGLKFIRGKQFNSIQTETF